MDSFDSDRKIIMKLLEDFGLTEKESELYIFLAKSGVQKGGDISKNLRMHKAHVYRILKSLQSRGMVESSLEFPMRFTAIPFEKVIDLLVKTKRKEAGSLQEEKSSILAHWRCIAIEESTPPSEKFLVIEGRSRIYSKISQMVEKAEKEILTATTSLGIIRAYRAGLMEPGILRRIEKCAILTRLLTYVSKENLPLIKRMIQEISNRHLSIELRHLDLVSKIYPRLEIIDDKEALWFITPKEDLSIISQEDTGLWTNSKVFVQTLKAFFQKLWVDAIDVDKRIQEIETGKPIEETVIIRDPHKAYKKLRGIADAAKEEMISIISPKGIIRTLETIPVQEYSRKGVKIRIMAPITSDNLEAARKLSQYCEIRHTDVSHIRMAIIDNRHLFQYKTPPLDKESTDISAYLDHMLYTNDLEYVKAMSEILDDLWNRSLNLSEIVSEAAMRSPPIEVSTSDPASKVIDNMLDNNIGSVLVVEDNRPIGIITEKDLLNRVIKPRREPERIFVKEIMSTPVVTIDADRPLIEALRIMSNKGIRRLAVAKDGKVIGILTERRALEKIRRQAVPNVQPNGTINNKNS